MNMFEEARSVRGMMEMCGLTQSEMAKRLGVSQSYVANKQRLLGYSPECERIILESGMTERHARAVLKLREEELRLSALTRIRDRGLNVAESEALVDMLHDAEAPARIGAGGRLKRIDGFMDTLKRSVETLISLGVDASHSVSYHGNKTYITVCIDEH
ncbi:MAG: hypothetical protein IJY69_02610 [Clostridia bacterium]|nr:hypothetical protein [Clostridia bacterium]